MVKKSISWNELIQVFCKKAKALGEPCGMKDVIKKYDLSSRWKKIKNGSDSDYVVGAPPKRGKKSKSKGKKSKGKSTKTRKVKKSRKSRKTRKAKKSKKH
jgi:hypothetical protein